MRKKIEDRCSVAFWNELMSKIFIVITYKNFKSSYYKKNLMTILYLAPFVSKHLDPNVKLVEKKKKGAL